MSLARYYHTLRYLRPVQVYGRVAHRLPRPVPEACEAPRERARTRGFPLEPQRVPSMLGACRFSFLNLTRDVQTASDWNDSGVEKLWLYNLHYFDDLTASRSDERNAWHQGLIKRWVDENAPGHGNGWEPYPSSMRIVNWVKWALSGSQLSAEATRSLAHQCRHLTRRLEHHLQGNHLWKNGKALAFGGAYFEGAEATGWLRIGLDIIDQQLDEQVLADGGHFELSPMYHAIFVEDLLDLVGLDRCFPGLLGDERVRRLRSATERMLDWLRSMAHPDGEIAFFNDASTGIALHPQVLRGWARGLGIRTEHIADRGLTLLGESGYARMQAGEFVLLADVGRIGPDYIPGHAHADTLSFELSWRGQRVLSNSGTSCYGTSPQRQVERGTAAHNTVTVDNEDSSEVWHGFRVARRARPVALHVETRDDAVVVECSHDGYTRLKGKPMHRRLWQLNPQGLVVDDRIIGASEHRATGRLHVHPGVRVESSGEREFVLDVAGAGRLRLRIEGSVEARTFAGTFAWEFGRITTRPVIEWTRFGALPTGAAVHLQVC